MSTNLSRPVRETIFAGEQYLILFDMTSVRLFKELTQKSYVQHIQALSELDDEAILSFLATSMRRKETPDEPLGTEIYNMDIGGLLTAYNKTIVELLTQSLPSPTSSVKPKGK